MPREHPGLADRRAANSRDDIDVGEICLARPDRGPDLIVLVIEVHEDHVQAMLCSDEHHLATDTDSVLEPRQTGYLGHLLVHGDVAGRIVPQRLVHSVGRVDPVLVERIVLRGRNLDFSCTDLGRGRAILDASDPRWEWKLGQFRRLRTVQARASELGWEICKFGDAGPREA